MERCRKLKKKIDKIEATRGRILPNARMKHIVESLEAGKSYDKVIIF